MKKPSTGIEIFLELGARFSVAVFCVPSEGGKRLRP